MSHEPGRRTQRCHRERWGARGFASRRGFALPLTLAALLGPASIVGQTVSGVVSDRDSRDVVEGAFVVLLDADGRRRDGFLTPPDGRYRLRLPEPGPYRLLVERIGYRNEQVMQFVAEPDESIVIDVVVATEPIDLDGLEVETAPRCRPDAGGARTAQVWEEARKALAVAAWTDRNEVLDYETTLFEREVDPQLGRVRRQESETRRGRGRHPFASVPAERLEAAGYVQPEPDGDGTLYFAPDAAVLLSDSFLRTHCFTSTLDEGRLGLRFEPTPDRRVPEIRGVFWLDPGSARLQRLEYSYVHVHEDLAWPWPRAAANPLGGEIEFERLDSGAWIVRSWVIRMPLLAMGSAFRRTGPPTPELVGVREEGGYVTRVSERSGAVVTAPDRGNVGGVAWDSLRATPLADAVVFLSGTNHSARTGVDGGFRMDGVLEGTYDLVLDHPRLERLDVRPPRRMIQIVRGRTRSEPIGLPSLTTLFADACGEDGRVGRDATVVGAITRSASGEPAAGARVEVWWFHYRTGAPTGGRPGNVEVESDQEGHFVACGVPPGFRVAVRARLGSVASPVAEMGVLGERAFAEARLALGERPLRLVGVVLDARSGDPLAGADVWLGERALPVATDAAGGFELAGVARGWHDIRVRHARVGTGSTRVDVTEPARIRVLVAPGEVRIERGTGS